MNVKGTYYGTSGLIFMSWGKCESCILSLTSPRIKVFSDRLINIILKYIPGISSVNFRWKKYCGVMENKILFVELPKYGSFVIDFNVNEVIYKSSNPDWAYAVWQVLQHIDVRGDMNKFIVSANLDTSLLSIPYLRLEIEKIERRGATDEPELLPEDFEDLTKEEKEIVLQFRNRYFWDDRDEAMFI
jgi:hypothetical protein